MAAAAISDETFAAPEPGLLQYRLETGTQSCMSYSDPTPSSLPSRVQPLLAAIVGCALVAMAAWYVASGGLSGRLVHHDAPPPGTARFNVNVNAATAPELAQLPGLGPATAARIIDHRRAHGPFRRPEDLLDVPGIGPATLEQMRPHLRPIRGGESP